METKAVISKRMKKRRRIVHKLIQIELRNIPFYRSQLADSRLSMSKAERGYKEKVISAMEKTRKLLKPEQQRFLYYAYLCGEKSCVAVCEKIGIEESTYYNWQVFILTKMGMFMGVE